MNQQENYYSQWVGESMYWIKNNESKNGSLSIRIYIEGNDFLDKTPMKIMDRTLNHISYDDKGAVAGSKAILGNWYMCPDMVCPFNNICHS